MNFKQLIKPSILLAALILTTQVVSAIGCICGPGCACSPCPCG